MLVDAKADAYNMLLNHQSYRVHAKQHWYIQTTIVPDLFRLWSSSRSLSAARANDVGSPQENIYLTKYFDL